MKRIFQTAVIISLLLLAKAGFCVSPEFELIRKKIVAELMAPSVNDAKVKELVATIKPDGTWPDINYVDVSREGFENRHHHANMVVMARAYKTKTSAFYKSKKVKSAIELALKHWVEKDYICDNWHPNQIGTPSNLVYLMLMMGNELPADLVQKAQPIIGRAHLNASGARPSGDRIKIAGILAKNLLFLGDEPQFAEVMKVIEGEIKPDSVATLDSAQMKQVAVEYLEKSKAEKEFIEKFEREEKYNLSTIQAETNQNIYVFFRPTKGVISSTFNMGEGQYGINIITSPNESVVSVLAGTVVYAAFTFDFGWVIQVQHEDNYLSIYKNNTRLLKKAGDKVKAGEGIAVTGEKAESKTGTQFYFELWKQGKPVNPEDVIIF